MSQSDSVASNSTLSQERVQFIYVETESDQSLPRTQELATPDVVYQPWCIQYPQLEPAQSYELKYGLIHLLHKFHGLAGEDSPQALKRIPCALFHNEAVGDTRGLHQNEGISIFLGWSCKGLSISTVGSLQHLGRHERNVPENFFLASKSATIRKEIYRIRQHSRETLHEYWERFNKLCVTCPHHQISLAMMDRSMIDVASGGALIDKTPTTTRYLISNMASNTQQFEIKGANRLQMVNKISAVDNLRLENQLTELTSLVRQLAVG
ncbi:hypothetical protein CR513_39239, partial [Mucuna pruriens]